MNKSMKEIGKIFLSKAMVAVLVLLTVLVLPNSVAKGATAPTLTKTSRNILVGETYDLNIKNKIKNSKYTWTSSDKSIATVDNKGIVKGIKKGTAVITCTVKAPKKTYKLTCQVNIIKPATSFKIKNKVTALNLGQKYDLNRTLVPSNSNDKTTWTSSDETIAVPDSKGVFTALKEGTVTITGKTLGGKSDSVTIKVVDKNGTVSNQEELTALVGSGVNKITIKTDEEVDLTIPSGDYPDTKLVVDAPKADIHNNGTFASIEIKQIAANSWYENAKGNSIYLLAKDARIIVTPNAKVKIEVNNKNATLNLENNGLVDELLVTNAANLNITGSSSKNTPVIVWADKLNLSTSIPLNLELNTVISLTLMKGSEATVIQAASSEVIPSSITGNFKVTITIGSGDNKTTKEIIPTPLPTEITGGSFGGGIGGGAVGGGSNPGVTETVNPDGSVDYKLSKPYTALSSIQVTYRGTTETISGGTLATLQLLLGDDALAISTWRGITKTTVGGGQVLVEGSYGSSTKTVTIVSGSNAGKSFEVTVTGSSSVTITNLSSGTNYSITRLDDYTLRVSADPDLTIVPTF